MLRFKGKGSLQYSTFWNDYTYYTLAQGGTGDAMFDDKSLCTEIDNKDIVFEQIQQKSRVVESFKTEVLDTFYAHIP